MREIKFRALYEGAWLPAYFDRDGWYVIDPEAGTKEYINEIPPQYTGLKDKNGREIYEGDIVKWEWLGNEERGDVRWDDDMAQFFAYDRTGRMLSATEVIGNIYEDSHLLEAK